MLNHLLFRKPLGARQSEIVKWRKTRNLAKSVPDYELSNELIVRSYSVSKVNGEIERKVEKNPFIVGLRYVVKNQDCLFCGCMYNDRNDALLFFRFNNNLVLYFKRDTLSSSLGDFSEVNDFDNNRAIFDKNHQFDVLEKRNRTHFMFKPQYLK